MSKPAVVSVSHLPRNPGEFEISIQTTHGRRLLNLRGGFSPSEAAARATMYALHHCFDAAGGYIVAHDSVMALIPPHLHFIAPADARTGTRPHNPRWPEITSDAIAISAAREWRRHA